MMIKMKYLIMKMINQIEQDIMLMQEIMVILEN